MSLQMVDLKAQVRSIRSELDVAIGEVLESGAYVRGRFVTEFEEALGAFLGAEHVVGVGNGTDALQIAYMALGVGPGSEVITPAFTFIATAEAAALLGARPVFVDIEPASFNLDPAALEDAITERTKAIVPVHLFGQPAAMDAISEIAERHGIPIVEDAAQSIGAMYRGAMSGTIGDFGCLSFYPSKNLGAFGDGGAIIARDPDRAERARTIANHGSRRKYFNEIVGVNSRLDALHAAMLSVKLRHLDDWNRARRQVAEAYDRAFLESPVVTPPRDANGTHVFHQYTIRVLARQRDDLRDHLIERDIPTMIYYPVPLHLLPVFEDLGIGPGSLPETERAATEVLSLPLHPHLSDADVERVAEGVLEFFHQHGE